MENEDDLSEVGGGTRAENESGHVCSDNKVGHEQGANPQCRTKNLVKAKLLVRSHAIREATSPPPDRPPSIESKGDAEVVISSSVSARRYRSKQFSSGQSSMESSSASCVSFSLSRDTGTDAFYTDNTGIDLLHFIVETLHRNNKDRLTLLRIEQDMVDLVKDPQRSFHKFPSMSSYQRMLVHRVAAFFGMEHNVDQTGTSVVVSKSLHTRLPERRFVEYVREDVVLPEEPIRKSILKRDALSLDDFAGNRRYRSPERRSKSFEDREDDYIRARHRVFHPQMSWNSSQEGTASESAYASCSQRSSQEELGWSTAANRRYNQGLVRSGRVPKVESFDGRELLSGYGTVLRPTVAKSYSFGGYTAPPAGAEALPRPDNHSLSVKHSGTRALAKQDSASSSISMSRLSPTSSGYKSQHSQSVSAATSPTPVNPGNRTRQASSTQNGIDAQSVTPSTEWTTKPSENVTEENGPSHNSCMWVVTNLESVPPGSILINPQTGQPFYNADGSVYRYDPSQPPPFAGSSSVATEREVELQQAYVGDAEEPKLGDYGCEAGTIVGACPPWPSYPGYETGATPTPVATPTPYGGPTGQPYYSDYGCCYVFPQAPAEGVELQATPQPVRAVALPVAYGQGYVLYHLAPPALDPSCETVPGNPEVELNPLMKNLCLRPVVNMTGYPSATVMQPDMSVGQAELVPNSFYAFHPRTAGGGAVKVVPSTPQFAAAAAYRPQLAATPGYSAMTSANPPYPNLPMNCGLVNPMSQPPYQCSVNSPQYPYVFSGQQPATAATAAAAAAAAAAVAATTPVAGNPAGQIPFTTGVAHHHNSTQFLPAGPTLMGSPAPSRGRTPDRETLADSGVTMRPLHVGVQHNRFPVIYGSPLATPVLAGDARQLRQSAALLHRTYPLQAHSPFSVRPRLTHQLSVNHGAVWSHQQQQQQHHQVPASRPPIRRNAQSHPSRNNAIPVTSSGSSSSSSPVQQRGSS